MLISPFLNMLINKLPRDTYLKLILMVLLIWSVYPTLTGDNFSVSEMIFFPILYLIGGFIRLHIDIDKINMKRLIALSIGSLIMTAILFGVFDSVSFLNKLSLFNRSTSVFWRTNSVFTVTSATLLFLIFLKRKEFSNRRINYIAGSVLGVYLIHGNTLVKKTIWTQAFHVQNYYSSSNLIMLTIAAVILVYVLSTMIDIVRRATIEKIWLRIIDNQLNNIPTWLNNKFEIFEEKISYYLK